MNEGVLFRWEEAASVLGCELFVPETGRKQAGFCAVSADSRHIEQDALFVALKGERTDGHRFVEGAFKAGAAGALVCNEQMDNYALIKAAESEEGVLLIVDNTLKALQLLAKAYLDKFSGLLRIGITGSSGKTTTKEIAAAIIGKEKRVVCNRANLNSDIGLPLSVFQVRAEHEAGIFEMGMNRRGEIAEITGVLRPCLALVTNVGSAHIGSIGTQLEIAKEKKAVFSLFTGKETALIPAGSEFAAFLAEGVNGNVRLYPDAEGVFDDVKDYGILGWECVIEGKKARFALPGRHNLQNAAAAVAIALAADIGVEAIVSGLSLVRPLPGRGEVVETTLGGRRVIVVNDCYNANPDSMEKALAFFDEAAWNGRKIVVAGEMLELGDRSTEEHEKLFSRLEAFGMDNADKTYFFHVSDMVFPDGNIAVYNDMEQLKIALNGDAREGDLVLLKGSRLCALERVLL
ncbi:MAG: UDP-N-acetylmuramoyl-tripeptide--D-alanyl-D-alanine ligase [Spirochaetaceae bacterium]|jgi:UDP-N-acetylmuramoyl-tripeptide--D-alanyl-D-alanine ligase|nr:UDP-N-acetylmuramoyl-tripeptide--D-alanyl-D-alanine ligase [Spirochaetaceae bacterium]